MAEDITTIKVLKKDRVWLESLFGQPTHIAFHKVRALCPHPVENRIYTSGFVAPYSTGKGVIKHGEQPRTVHGFRCGVCGDYVFPSPDPDPESE